jgi:hypothetical protein
VRLILHVGTHKTGTSALQACLRQNEGILASKGIHYARQPRSKHANGWAKLVAKGRKAESLAFLNHHIDEALRLGASTLLISAESFYAMTTFFHKFNGRNQDYWKSELEAIERLRDILPFELPVKLVVFFRRQDNFLESIYREVVKSKAVALSIDEFRLFMKEALDYWRHMQVWNAVFSDCAVFTYEEASSSIARFFFRNVLELANTNGFKGLDMRRNLRWSREVLEYKRMLNGALVASVDRRISRLVCTELARTLPDDGRYQDYLAPGARATLLSEMELGNVLLRQTFSMKAFPPLSDGEGWVPYPGLSAERARELRESYARIGERADYRIERSALVVRRFIQQRFPRLAWLIPWGRFLLPRHWLSS